MGNVAAIINQKRNKRTKLAVDTLGHGKFERYMCVSRKLIYNSVTKFVRKLRNYNTHKGDDNVSIYKISRSISGGNFF